jgi:hypothetical protein
MLFGRRGATWIYYSWFIAGVIGLSLSLYGLSGVEAGMLMEPAWNVGDATRLMLHADKTWGGPGGWLRTIKWALDTRGGNRRRSPSWLWFVLAWPTILVFVAWPLSGLTMETAQGFLPARAAVPAIMTGLSYDTFNERSGRDNWDLASLSWNSRQDAKVPGAGIVYTPEGFDRSQMAFLSQVPAVFPKDDGVTEIFITAQADQPIDGAMWGLLLQYNCSVISRAQDFRLINRFNRSLPHDEYHYSMPMDDKSLLARRRMNQTEGRPAKNLDAVVEIGVASPRRRRQNDPLADSKTPNMTDKCYFTEDLDYTKEYPGMDQHEVLEIALWQILHKETALPENLSPAYNYSIDHNLTGLFGAYDARDFRGLSQTQRNRSSPLPMTAIGVQCNASSSVGSATIDGIRSSYSSFQRTDTPLATQYYRCADRFSAEVPALLLDKEGSFWLAALFQTSAASPAYYESDDKADTTLSLRLGYLQAEQLRRVMLSAYASYAMQLMYNGGQPYTIQNGSYLTFTNPNATAFEPGPVIKAGAMPAAVPVTLFCIWALISCSLGILYGFRRRWTEILDGHTMFRLGAELLEHERSEMRKTSNIAKKEDRVALDEIPALVGDTKPDMWLGRIGLVRDTGADKKKLYE